MKTTITQRFKMVKSIHVRNENVTAVKNQNKEAPHDQLPHINQLPTTPKVKSRLQRQQLGKLRKKKSPEITTEKELKSAKGKSPRLLVYPAFEQENPQSSNRHTHKIPKQQTPEKLERDNQFTSKRQIQLTPKRPTCETPKRPVNLSPQFNNSPKVERRLSTFNSPVNDIVWACTQRFTSPVSNKDVGKFEDLDNLIPPSINAVAELKSYVNREVWGDNRNRAEKTILTADNTVDLNEPRSVLSNVCEELCKLINKRDSKTLQEPCLLKDNQSTILEDEWPNNDQFEDLGFIQSTEIIEDNYFSSQKLNRAVVSKAANNLPVIPTSNPGNVVLNSNKKLNLVEIAKKPVKNRRIVCTEPRSSENNAQCSSKSTACTNLRSSGKTKSEHLIKTKKFENSFTNIKSKEKAVPTIKPKLFCSQCEISKELIDEFMNDDLDEAMINISTDFFSESQCTSSVSTISLNNIIDMAKVQQPVKKERCEINAKAGDTNSYSNTQLSNKSVTISSGGSSTVIRSIEKRRDSVTPIYPKKLMKVNTSTKIKTKESSPATNTCNLKKSHSCCSVSAQDNQQAKCSGSESKTINCCSSANDAIIWPDDDDDLAVSEFLEEFEKSIRKSNGSACQ